MSPPAVSVVMPVRDAAATLPAALDSLLAQTMDDWELLAVDDGSRDASPGVLAAYARRDVRIRVLSGPARGIVAALNSGLDLARGALVARMDADDLSLPERLARQREHLERHPAIGVVACRVRHGGDPASQAGYARHVAWTNALLAHEQIAAARFVESPLAHPSVMFRRELVTRLGGYVEGDVPEDYELWLRWLEAGVRFEKLAEPLLVWNDPPDRLSRRDGRYAPEAFSRLRARYLARWLAAHNPRHPSILLWGAGRATRRRARDLEALGPRIAAYVDIDPRKVGRRIAGRPVLAPAGLPRPGACLVVSYVGVPEAREAIEAELLARGYRPMVDYVLAA